jgi:hypothetical protein
MELKDSFRPYCKKAFFYKIPDGGGASHFVTARPFDVTACWEDIPLAIEAKALGELAAINYNLLEDSQKENLEKFEAWPGRVALVVVNIRQGRDILNDKPRINRMYYFTHKFLKEKKSVLKKELDDYPYIEGKYGEFNLNDFFLFVRKCHKEAKENFDDCL